MDDKEKISLLFVCMGNICRSPTAEAVFRSKVAEAGLSDQIVCDSAGTRDYHVGAAPDRRSRAAALLRGYDMNALRARQVNAGDFHSFDHVLAMDAQNLEELKRICPPQQLHKLHLFGDFDAAYKGQGVPDPYYGGTQGFERVLDMIEQSSASLLAYLAGKQRARG